jgi:hypothetical protein
MISLADLAALTSALSSIPGPVGWTALAGMGFWVVREAVMRGSRDLQELKAGASLTDGIDMLQKRVQLMDARIAKLESDRAKLMGFCTEVLQHFSSCIVCGKMAADRKRLQGRYIKIMEEISEVQR